jgi:hypothetical protein
MGEGGVLRAVRMMACAILVVLVWWALPISFPGNAAVEAQVPGARVPILVYHNIDYSGSAYSVTPEMLDAQCRWLIENGYTAITLGQFWDAAFAGGSLPPNPIVLTNDDGWSSAVTFAEILGRNGLVGNYFINNYSPLTADQIYLLMQNGPVQAHTANHQHMAQLDYPTQLSEIADNKAYIEGITGAPVQFVAWPFGEANASAVEAATAAGIVGAFGLGGRPCYIGALDPYHIPRIMMEPSDTLDTFAAKVTGW